jgi:IS1 family transposase/transposase-like protein
MGHDLLCHTLLLLGILWLSVLSRWVWPWRHATTSQGDRQPTKRATKRSREPKPFPGLTHKPHCTACEQSEQLVAPAPPAPPLLNTSSQGRPRQMETSAHFCPKPTCRYYGRVGLGNIRANGHPSSGRRRQLQCRACRKYFLETYGTLFHGKRVPPERLVWAVGALAEGLGLRAVSRVFQVDPNTVLQWFIEATDHAAALTRHVLHDVRVTQVQLDELFALLSAVKDSDVSDAEAVERLSRSPHWVWGAMDPVTKLLLTIDVGDRTLAMAQRLVHQVVQVVALDCVPLFLTDGFKEYMTALLTHYGHWVQPPRRQAKGSTPKLRWMPRPALLYAQVVKNYRCRRLVRVSHRVVFGTLDQVKQVLAAHDWQINTAFIERINLDIRQHVAAVGRRVTTLCKHEAGLRQQLALYQVYHNFCLPHASLRQPLPQPVPTNGSGSAQKWRPQTPAMAAGLTDHVWSLREVLSYRVPPRSQP